LWILIGTLSNGPRYLKTENSTLLPFFDNSKWDDINNALVRVQFILHKVLLQYGKGKSRFYQQDTPFPLKIYT